MPVSSCPHHIMGNDVVNDGVGKSPPKASTWEVENNLVETQGQTDGPLHF